MGGAQREVNGLTRVRWGGKDAALMSGAARERMPRGAAESDAMLKGAAGEGWNWPVYGFPPHSLRDWLVEG